MTATLSQRVSEELRAALARKRMTGRELARRMQAPPSSVARWLAGDCPLTVDDVERMADAVQIDMVDLMTAARAAQSRPVSGPFTALGSLIAA
jgi:transcriptional regulator with XRE-family HTH domain